MLGTYSHLVDQDSNNAVFRENGIMPAVLRRDDLKPRTCQVCSEVNPPEGKHCIRCGNSLLLESLYTERSPKAQQDTLRQLLGLLVKRGVTDETIEILEKAGLGPTLQELVKQDRP